MEAANLGATMANCPDEALQAALGTLRRVPDFVPSVSSWAQTGFDVLAKIGDPAPTLGIPTWFYGHEPPNVFATAIAKYFANSVRESVLLQRCDGGIVFLPGAGGTVQEIFQDGCENYYATGTAARPMVLLGVDHWTSRMPAWPLLTSLAAGRPMERGLMLTDDPSEAIDFLKRYRTTVPNNSPRT